MIAVAAVQIVLCAFATAAWEGAPAATAGQDPAPAQERTWTYDPQGRRDPFISLRGVGTTMSSTENRPRGLSGVTIGELTLRGIVRSDNAFVALAQSPDGRTFQLRQNDRLFDGRVKEITFEAVVFVQQVNDPLSLVREREVRKTMKAGEREEEEL